MGEFYNWTSEQRAAWGDHMAAIGLISKADAHDFKKLEAAWKQLLDSSAAMYAAGLRLTPFEVADKIGAETTTSNPDNESSNNFTGKGTTPSSHVVLTDATSAQTLIDAALQKELGRKAKPAEVSAFIALLNQREQENPVNTTTTQDVVNGQVQSESSTETGGVDSGQIADHTAITMPEYGAYQAATTYFNALQNAIHSPV
jgi:hypothetical protein